MKEHVLVVLPAFNEENTIAQVLLDLRTAAPDFDRLVVTDGSEDETSRIVERLGERQLNLPCNLGYGLALQAGMKFALEEGYDVIVTLDADGQHNPQDVPALVEVLLRNQVDLVIGSRYCDTQNYRGPLGRRLGQVLFSSMTGVLLGSRIYDTTSGFKALRAEACELIAQGTFLDFHLETIVRLSLLGFKIIEHPVLMKERSSGVSMHSFFNALQYPVKTSLLTLVATADALLTRNHR